MGWRPELEALAATASLVVRGLILPYRGQRAGPKALLTALSDTSSGMIEIVMISAAAGIVIGVLNISGLSFALTLKLVAIGVRPCGWTRLAG